MKIRWYGHSCFLFTTAAGDAPARGPLRAGDGLPPCGHPGGRGAVQPRPFRPQLPRRRARHAAGGGRRGRPCVRARRASRPCPPGTTMRAGPNAGHNLVFVIEADGLRAVHLGDLGHVPDAAQAAAIGRPDVLCIPVGGTFTIDAAGRGAHGRAAAPAADRAHALPHGAADLPAGRAGGRSSRRSRRAACRCGGLPRANLSRPSPCRRGRRRCCRPARPNKGGGRAKKGLPAPRRGSTMVVSPNRAVPGGLTAAKPAAEPPRRPAAEPGNG